MNFDDFIKNVMSLDAEEIILASAALREAELADANVENLNNHKTSLGKDILPIYSSFYAAFKGFEIPDLKLTGDFHSGIFADVKGDGIIFDSTDWKNEKLTLKYGVDIYGVENKQLVEIIDADVVSIMDKKMTGK